MRNNYHYLEICEPKPLPILTAFLLFFSDLLGLCFSFYLATIIRRALIPYVGGQVSWSYNFPIILIGVGFIMLLFAFFDLYPGYGKTAIKEIERLVKVLSLVYGFLAVTVYFLKLNPDFPRSIFLFAWSLSILIIPLMRIILRNRLSFLNWYGKPILFIIKNENDINAVNIAIRSRRMGWRPLAIHILKNTSFPEYISEVPVVSSIDEMINLGKEYNIDSVVFTAIPFSDLDQKELAVIRKINAHFNSIILMSSTFELGSTFVKIRDLEGYLGLELHYNLLDPVKKILKRIIDSAASVLLMILTIPIWIIIPLMIKLDSKGPIFYQHLRIGKDDNPFMVLKFRTMVINADEILKTYLDSHSLAKQEWDSIQKLSHDPRITKIGYWLRKFSLDELPQIWNVFLGEMSLIGPRAVTDEEVLKYGDYGPIILRTKPGITGWWQVMGRNETTWEQRTRFEVYYVSNWSLLMDFYITVKTIWVIISGQGR